jgi:hypothetical protein
MVDWRQPSHSCIWSNTKNGRELRRSVEDPSKEYAETRGNPEISNFKSSDLQKK